MKKLILGLSALLSLNAFATEIKTAKVDYECSMDGVIQTGTVSIDDKFIVGSGSTMVFGKESLTWRFERLGTVNNLFLTLRSTDDLRPTPGIENETFYYLSNRPINFKTPVKTKFFSKKKDLECVFSNVEWDFNSEI